MNYPLTPVHFHLTEKEISHLNQYVSRDDLHPNLWNIFVSGNTYQSFFNVLATDAHRMFWIEKQNKVKGENSFFNVILPKNIEAGEIILNPDHILNNGKKIDYPVIEGELEIPEKIIPRLDNKWFTDVPEWYMRLCMDALSGSMCEITQKVIFDIHNQVIKAERQDEFFSSNCEVEFMQGLEQTKGHLFYNHIALNLKFLQEIFKYKKSKKTFRIFWPETNLRALTIMDMENYNKWLLMPIMH